uniref:RNA-dependent RNA polymerase n=1 Tax=Erysiphales narna-like virus 2 TaxID=2719865 RepID=A0A6G9ELM4_9VIRU|nr:RNA-dependent RNA polymerase [Erysiphales narna-like virus 2]
MRLIRWLDNSLSVKGALAFSRVARALPCAPETVQREAYDKHAYTLYNRHCTPPKLLENIRVHVRNLCKGLFENIPLLCVPSSSAATVEVSRPKGGYSSYIHSLKREAWQQAGKGYLRGGRPPPGSGLPERSQLASYFEGRLSRRIREDARHDHPVVLSAIRNQASATAWLLRREAGARVCHRSTVIAELGMKARIITIPPAQIFAQGDLVRQVIWPRLLRRIPQIRPYAPHTEESALRRVARGFDASRIFLSADLTCATDGFGHDAICAVIAGLKEAGLPALFVSALTESLGVGANPHYVRYHLSKFTAAGIKWAKERFPVVDGCVEIPKMRGSLMGTPCSFLILSLLNHWMSEPLGKHRIICGDDLAAATHQENVPFYASRAEAVGAQLHDGKSYRSKIGFVFCEAYALTGEKGSLISFRPPSIKEFVREGNGVMCQHSVDSTSFNRLARCARTIYKSQRKIAMKKHRPAELPASLGGLGHPCKGRLRVPKWCRRALWELYLCTNADHGLHDPTKVIRTLQVPAIPNNRKSWKSCRDNICDFLREKIITDPDNYVSDGFIPNKYISEYESISTNFLYLNTGNGSRKVRAQEVKPGKIKWPVPCSTTGVLSTSTRINQVLEWDRMARCELGHYFPTDFSAHIRGRIPAYRSWEAPGDVGP